mmetsp:Transcript_28077/g.65611  ORF Transcript_28077/g.65611 Transcript_28077/m.65611 type:complete len:244 (-) Transcript_28077:8-739(-)
MQELDNITGLLGNSRRGSIGVFHAIILQGRRHRNATTGEVRVVVQRFHHFLTSGFVHVSSQEGKDIVVPFVASTNHNGQIGWESSAIGSGALLVVLVRGRHFIIGFGRSLKHFTFLVRTVHNHAFFGQGSDFFFGVSDTGQLTPTDKLQRVTGGANFTVHLESTTQCAVIKRCKPSTVSPWIGGRVQHTLGHECDSGRRSCGGTHRSTGGVQRSAVVLQGVFQLRGHGDNYKIGTVLPIRTRA